MTDSFDIVFGVGLTLIFCGLVVGIMSGNDKVLFVGIFIGMAMIFIGFFTLSRKSFESKVKIYKGNQEDECK